MVSKGKGNYANRALHVLKGESIFCVFCLQRCMPLFRGLDVGKSVCFRSSRKHPMACLTYQSGKIISVPPHTSAHRQADRVCHDPALPAAFLLGSSRTNGRWIPLRWEGVSVCCFWPSTAFSWLNGPAYVSAFLHT